MEKIDIHQTQQNYDKAIVKLKKDLSTKNYALIKDYLNDSSIGKTARLNARIKQVGIRARLKNLYLLKIIANFFDKPLDTITSKDMENFIRSLNENRIKKANGEKYSEKTKSNMKVILICFLRHIIKNQEKLHKLTDWIETRFKDTEIPALTEEEIDKLLMKANNIKNKVLIALLFDTGARIEEFLNIRIGDIVEVKDNVPYYKLTIKNEYSKTNGRTIALTWKRTNELLREWLENHPKKDDLNAQLFPATYDSVRIFLKRLGDKVLGKSINPHLFRHSSATYYAGKGMDFFRLCKKFGWSFNSKQPHRYIDRSGIGDKKTIEEFKSENLGEITTELGKMKENNHLLKEENEDLTKRFIELNDRVEKMARTIKLRQG